MSAPALIGGAIRVLPDIAPLPLPWCTRSEAAEYLRFSTDWIDQRLVLLDRRVPGRVPGKIRFVRVSQPIRIVSEDVIAILPPPPEDV